MARTPRAEESAAIQPAASAAAASQPDYSQQPELALVALLQMLSRTPAPRSEALAMSIAAHFRLIAAEARQPAALRAAAAELGAHWQALVELDNDATSIH